MAAGKSIIITGGTGALGRSVASLFLNKGMRVAIPVRPGTMRTEFPVELLGGGENIIFREADLSSETDVTAFVSDAAARFGSVDIVVNAAGGYAGGEAIGDVSLATLERMLTINLRTAFLMCSAVLPLMRGRKFGRIINIAAMPALSPAPLRGPYAIAKRGVITLTESIAEEVKGSGITANAIAPSIILTPANTASMPKADTSRWVSPEEIAAIILFLCSDDARSLNGNVFKAYGGV